MCHLTTPSPRRLFVFASICLAGLVLCDHAPAKASEAARIHTFESALRPAISVVGASEARWTLRERMEYWKVPGISVAVIRNGKIAWARAYGVRQAGSTAKVDTETMFSVGSVSKVGAAAVTLRLVDEGRVDLDRDVNSYLSRWQVPASSYTAVRPVTLRGILSHSSGLTVHGFADFQPGENLPTAVDTLLGRAPAKNEAVRVIHVPGERFLYSGGGTTVEELVIEEVTGRDFPKAARQLVFEPLGMTRSTYENPVPETYTNVAKAHGNDGQPRALPRGYEAMPQMAASGLWTTPMDYAKLVIAFIESYRGKVGNFLRTDTARQMLTEVGRSPAGLGPFLEGEGLDRRFFHGGSNDSYKAWMEGHPGTGNGMVIFTNGANGGRLYREVSRAVAVAEGWTAALSHHVKVPGIALSASELRERAGVYEIQPSSNTLGFRHRIDALVIRVSERDGSLHLRTGDEEEVQQLVPSDASRFVMDTDRGVVSVEFVRDYGGKVSALILRGAAGYLIEARK